MTNPPHEPSTEILRGSRGKFRPATEEKREKTSKRRKERVKKEEKRGKKCKKGLTKGEESGNIIKLRKGAGARETRKTGRTRKEARICDLERTKMSKKKLEKSFENPLTNGTEYDILNKLS